MPEFQENELDIDALIESALMSEPLLPVPVTLHRKVEERLRIVQLREREMARFRYLMTTMVVVTVCALGLVAGLITFTHLGVLMSNGVSGGRGQYDTMLNEMMLTITSYSGAYSLIISMFLAAGTLLLGLIPLKKYIGTH